MQLSKKFIIATREALLDRDKTVLIAKGFIDSHKSELVKYLASDGTYSSTIERMFLHSIDLIHNTCESEVEIRLFSSFILSAFVTKFDMARVYSSKGNYTEIVQNFYEVDKYLLSLEKEYLGDYIRKPKEILWLLKAIERDKKVEVTDLLFILDFIFTYHVLRGKYAAHISLQPEIYIQGKLYRPDAIIWIPDVPNFKLVVECDGYKYHSDESMFTSDRVRDRDLISEGFKVMRFSGKEIYREPIQAGYDLLKILIKVVNKEVS